MRHPKHSPFRPKLIVVLLLNSALLMQPTGGFAANQDEPVYRSQDSSKIYVEPFTTSATADLPFNHADVGVWLTNALRKQLEEESLLQADPRLHALKLVGVILSYRGDLLNVQAELYDGDRYLAYSRVERQMESDGDWGEEIELVAEQLLDELIGDLRRNPQPSYSLQFNIMPNDCSTNNGYSGSAGCTDGYYGGWGWWRHQQQHHGEHRVDDEQRHHKHQKHQAHDDHDRHPHDKHATDDPRHHEHHLEKPHWVSDAVTDHHHRSRRVDGAIPAGDNPKAGLESPRGAWHGEGSHHEIARPSSDTGTVPLNASGAAANATRPDTDARIHHPRHHSPDALHDSASSTTPMIKPDSAESTDSAMPLKATSPHADKASHHSRLPLDTSAEPGAPVESSSPLSGGAANLDSAQPSTIANKPDLTPDARHETKSTEGLTSTSESGLKPKHHEHESLTGGSSLTSPAELRSSGTPVSPDKGSNSGLSQTLSKESTPHTVSTSTVDAPNVSPASSTSPSAAPSLDSSSIRPSVLSPASVVSPESSASTGVIISPAISSLSNGAISSSSYFAPASSSSSESSASGSAVSPTTSSPSDSSTPSSSYSAPASAVSSGSSTSSDSTASPSASFPSSSATPSSAYSAPASSTSSGSAPSSGSAASASPSSASSQSSAPSASPSNQKSEQKASAEPSVSVGGAAP